MDYRVGRAINFINANLDGQVVLSEVARSLNLSCSRLRQIFKNELGVSPKRYLRLRRMEEARVLLEETILSVKEITAKVGISDESHFVRDFSKEYGIPPGRYRARYFASSRDRRFGQ